MPGNIGIGTTSPTGQLEIKSTTASFPNGWDNNLELSASSYPALYLRSTTTDKGYILGQDGDNGALYFDRITAGTHQNYAMVLDGSGNVGIGTTAPADKLDVAGAIGITTTTATAPVVGIYSPSAGALTLTATGSGNITLQLGLSGNFSAGYNAVANGGFASAALGFQTTASGIVSTAMGDQTVASGAGSTAMGYTTTAASYIETVIGRFNALGASTSGNGWVATDPLFEIGNGSNTVSTSDAMVVLKNGSVGIGTTGPGALLEVNGTTKLDSTTTVSGALNATATMNMAGAINATGLASGTVASGKYLGLNASNQVVLGSAGVGAGIALNSITAASGSNTIDNAGNAQSWSWNSLSSGTAFTISSNSMTGGMLFSLQNTAASATSTGDVLSVTNASTGPGYALYSAMTATGNTGYAGYFASSSTGAGYALYATITGQGNTGYAGFFSNTGSGYALAATGTSYFNGYVGIGITNPATALHVYTTSSTNGITVAGTTNPAITLGNGSSYLAYIGVATSAGAFDPASQVNDIVLRTNGGALRFNTDDGTGTSPLTILGSNGSVGIGTTGPGALLEVNGTTKLDSTTTVSGALNATATMNMAGAINATGLASGTVASGKYLGLNASNQVVLGSAGVGAGIALNSITGATAPNTIDNAANAQSWTWNSLSSGTAFTISSNSMTTGTLLSLQNTAAAATSTGQVLSISDMTTGAGYGIYSAMSGHGNNGYAGFFTNTDTGADANYGIYASSASASGYGGYFTNTSTGGTGLYVSSNGTTGPAISVTAQNNPTGYGSPAAVNVQQSGSGGSYPGIAIVGDINNNTNSQSVGIYGAINSGSGNGYGVEGQSNSTDAGTGVFGNEYGAANTGYGGYFTNAATNGANYGVYGTDASASGYGGYFTNTGTGWALAATGTSTFNGNVGIGTTAPSQALSVNGSVSVGATGNNATIYFPTSVSSEVPEIESVYASNTLEINSGSYGLTVSGSGSHTLTGNFTVSGADGNAAFTVNQESAAWPVVADFQVAGSSVMRVTSTGSVGIGTTSPGSLLEVDGTTELDSTTTIGGTANFNGAINATGLSSGTVATGKYLGLNSSNQVVLGAGGSGGGNTALSSITSATTTSSIDSNNNAISWAWGTLSTQTALTLTTSSMTTGSLLSLQDTAVGATSTGQVLSISDATTGAGYGVYSTMSGTGNTGYAGYFTNTATSGVNYAIYALNTSTSGFAIYCNATYLNGCGGTQAWFSSSDIRLKENIVTLPAERGLGAIMKLRPVTYHWKDKTLDQRQMVGFIAQEVEPIYPEAVGMGPNGMKSLAYADLVVPLVKAVQQQQAEIEALKLRGSQGKHTVEIWTDGDRVLLFVTGGWVLLLCFATGMMGALLLHTRREVGALRQRLDR